MKKINTLSLLCLFSIVTLAFGCTKAEEPIKALVTANIQSTESVIIDNQDVNVDFTITLTQRVSQDVEVRVVPKGDVAAINLPVSSFIFKTMSEDEDGKIVSPEITKTGSVVFKASAFPNLTSVATVELVLESDDITISQDSKAIIVGSKKQPVPPAPITATITAAESEITMQDVDKNVEFTINLSEPLTNNATFSLEATSESGVANSYELNNQSITIDAGQTIGVGSLTFKAAAFTSENIVVEVKVTASTESEVVITEPSITIKATKKAAN